MAFQEILWMKNAAAQWPESSNCPDGSGGEEGCEFIKGAVIAEGQKFLKGGCEASYTGPTGADKLRSSGKSIQPLLVQWVRSSLSDPGHSVISVKLLLQMTRSSGSSYAKQNPEHDPSHLPAAGHYWITCYARWTQSHMTMGRNAQENSTRWKWKETDTSLFLKQG